MAANQRKVIYQLALRTFTPEGTLTAAARLLPHIASLGVDIVYVCPFYVEENDEDRACWSKRQLASNTNNPKNPYKIADYFHVDEEYGTDVDLKAFVAEAHRLGLLVMFDLVYLHCGRHAVFIDENPDFVERNADGSVKVPDRWPFARLNFASRALREYLMANMVMLLTEYGADGFRCDVGDSVPLDFWQEAFARMKTIRPAMITLNEGIRPEYVEETFDMGYAFAWTKLMVDIFAREKPASALREYDAGERQTYGDNVHKLIRTIDNHDTASDCRLNRNEIIMTSRGVEAALVITNTFPGVPLMWNGYEVCDDAENCMFSNRDYGRRSALNWSKGFTADGVRRMAFIREIHRLAHDCAVLRTGALEWVGHDAPDAVIAYRRSTDDARVLVIVNSKNKAVTVTLDHALSGTRLLASGALTDANTVTLEPYGYLIVRE